MGRGGANISHDELLGELRTMIVDGHLPPGSRIPERELCERFAISRTPLREALKVLASEGHVVLLPNRGARVAQLTTTDVEELFEVSEALDALAGELACARITETELAELKAMHEELALQYRRRDIQTYYGVNRRIHEAIVRIAGNAVLSTIYEQVSARIRRARFVAMMPDDRWEEAMNEHEGIMNALVRRDPVTMVTIMRQHLRNKSKQVVEAGFATAVTDVEGAAPPPRGRKARVPAAS